MNPEAREEEDKSQAPDECTYRVFMEAILFVIPNSANRCSKPVFLIEIVAHLEPGRYCAQDCMYLALRRLAPRRRQS